ncbi:MAG: cache domain-containing protein, partial [Thermodesulfobacteriota bacterium]
THFYFIEPDKTCFLRVHSPENFGDEITRFTLKKATDTSKISSGIELGSLGTFTLRVVFPWIVNGKLLGYLELGEEIEHLTPRLREISDLDLIFTIDKSNLAKEKWEAGVKALNKKGDWNEFADFVIIDKTISTLSFELKNVVQQNYLHGNSRNISLNNRSLSIYSHPLQDVTGKQVGTIIAICDVTNLIIETRKAVMSSSVAILALFLTILLFYYKYSGTIENQVAAYRDNLENLVKERTRELHVALDEVKTLSGFLPICASCKQIRDDKGYWTQIESYISKHSEAEFSHSICPECTKNLYPDFVDDNGDLKK